MHRKCVWSCLAEKFNFTKYIWLQEFNTKIIFYLPNTHMRRVHKKAIHRMFLQLYVRDECAIKSFILAAYERETSRFGMRCSLLCIMRGWEHLLTTYVAEWHDLGLCARTTCSVFIIFGICYNFARSCIGSDASNGWIVRCVFAIEMCGATTSTREHAVCASTGHSACVLRANKQRAYVRLRRMLLHKLCQKWIGDKRPEPETKKKCVPCSDKHVMADAADTS